MVTGWNVALERGYSELLSNNFGQVTDGQMDRQTPV